MFLLQHCEERCWSLSWEDGFYKRVCYFGWYGYNPYMNKRIIVQIYKFCTCKLFDYVNFDLIFVRNGFWNVVPLHSIIPYTDTDDESSMHSLKFSKSVAYNECYFILQGATNTARTVWWLTASWSPVEGRGQLLNLH